MHSHRKLKNISDKLLSRDGKIILNHTLRGRNTPETYGECLTGRGLLVIL